LGLALSPYCTAHPQGLPYRGFGQGVAEEAQIEKDKFQIPNNKTQASSIKTQDDFDS
jgi:hypothetical protein